MINVLGDSLFKREGEWRSPFARFDGHPNPRSSGRLGKRPETEDRQKQSGAAELIH